MSFDPPARAALPAEIRAARFVLRRQHPGLAALVKDAVDSSLAHLQSSVAWAQTAPTPLAQVEAFLGASEAAFDAGDAWSFSILDPAETRVIGGVAMERAEDAVVALVGPETIEAGYWLRSDCVGAGYASEATACVVDLAFDRLHASRVVICHDPANTASAGVPRRLGFRCLGRFPDAVVPGRLRADGSVRAETMVWVRESVTPRARWSTPRDGR